MSHSFIRSMGRHAPAKVLTNADLEHIVETSDEWILTRTGIRKRHVAEPDQAISDLALPAARDALARAGIAADELTHIIFATMTPDNITPSAACMLQHKLGTRGQTALDVNAACSGFVYGLQTARAFVCIEPSARILVASGDILSTRMNWEDRTTCVLFGDGAGAAVVTGEDFAPTQALPEDSQPQARIVDARLASDGGVGGLLTVKGGGSSHPYKLGDTVGPEFFVQMQGSDVFKHAVRSMDAICRELLDANAMAPQDVDLLVPHQANLRIIEALGKKLGMDAGKVFVNVDEFGNTSAGSIPLALTQCMEEGRVRPGMRVLLTAFGGGFTWGAVLLHY